MQDRQALWSAVEGAEKRKDAQLAREIEVALPHELTEKQREDLVTAFAQENFVNKGMVVDVCFHSPGHNKGDARNCHAHLLITMRAIGPDGFGKKVREWNKTAQLHEWRRQWEHLANCYLERNGHKEKIDHRSYKERGINRDPTIHMGPTATILERRGINTRRGKKLRTIGEKNCLFQKKDALNRNKAIKNIKRDKENCKRLNQEDIRNLSHDERENIKIYGLEYLDTILQQQTLQRNRGGKER